MGVAKEGEAIHYTMHSYWLLLSCGLLALAGADKFKLCLSSDPAGNQCLGVEQGLVTLKSADDSSTNWAVFESAGSGGAYFENLESCTVATIEDETLRMRQKTDSSSQGWLFVAHAPLHYWDPPLFRLYNQAFTNDDQPSNLDATSTRLTMSQLVDDKETQKFFKVETEYESSACPFPESNDIDAQALRPRSGPCRRGRAFVYGRCQKVYKPLRRERK